LNIAELKQALFDGVKEKVPGLRDAAITKLMGCAALPCYEAIVELNRSLFPKNPV